MLHFTIQIHTVWFIRNQVIISVFQKVTQTLKSRIKKLSMTFDSRSSRGSASDLHFGQASLYVASKSAIVPVPQQ